MKILRKIVLSVAVVASFVVYAVYQRAASVATNTPEPQNSGGTAANISTGSPPSVKQPVAGQYADGEYTGPVADAYYGNVQVKAIVRGGKLAEVQFLSFPNDQGNSQYINSIAVPQLRGEAIAAQSAKVDVVSGATATSQAFIESLSGALAAAKV